MADFTEDACKDYFDKNQKTSSAKRNSYRHSKKYIKKNHLVALTALLPIFLMAGYIFWHTFYTNEAAIVSRTTVTNPQVFLQKNSPLELSTPTTLTATNIIPAELLSSSTVVNSSSDNPQNSPIYLGNEAEKETKQIKPEGTASCINSFERIFRDNFDEGPLGKEWRSDQDTGAIQIKDGYLAMTAQNDNDENFLPGEIRQTNAQRYGKYKFRIRTDKDLSLSTNGIVSLIAQGKNDDSTSRHVLYETGNSSLEREPFFSVLGETTLTHRNDASDWQVITFEWTPEHFQLTQASKNGEEKTSTVTNNENLAVEPHLLTIKLETVKNLSSAPVSMKIDWVEIYSYCEPS